ncbi:hypothetical protein SAMN05421818_10459 [Myroides phaeus]|uniref:Uncharacterized protein n=1 Tax=Myroides phaeus TaxID=702745 RepID=A0A1G8CHW3_9FLAO|nr:hypothetical protein SAMN05421818_10459 [Myroides phaeus]
MNKKLKYSSFFIISISLLLFVYQLYNITSQEGTQTEIGANNQLTDSNVTEIIVSLSLLTSGILLFKRSKRHLL